MSHTGKRVLASLALSALMAAPAAAGPLATLHADAAGVEWRPALPGAGLMLTVSGPEGFYLRQAFGPGERPSFSVFDGAGSLRPAGAYAWELRVVHQLDEGTRQELEAVRESGDEGALLKAGKLPAGPTYQSGSFSILDGAIVAGGLEEPAGAGRGPVLSTKVVHTEGVCAGFDCPATPAFGDSTILMMENNTRIKFGDTSASPFPNNDWEIEANSATSGALSYLGFNDCGSADNDGGCATDLVFAVEAGARQNALYVEGDDDVGLGTSNPVLDLHIVTGNTPALRLEQDGSSGFTPRVWDIAGNETNFFVRDVTGGSTLPFRIFPGAASSSLNIDDTSNVGVGTISPTSALHVLRSGGGLQDMLELEITGTGGRPRLTFTNDSGAWFYEVNGTNFDINRSGSGAPEELRLSAAGDLTIAGSLTVGPGGCTGCDLVFSPEYEVESIEEHAAYMWANRHLPGVGPTPEDQPMNLSKKTGGILNELEKAHIYIEELHTTIRVLEARAVEKDQAFEALQERLERLETALGLPD